MILYALLCGHLPFDQDDVKELYRKIALASYTVPSHLSVGTAVHRTSPVVPRWPWPLAVVACARVVVSHSAEATHLISRMLCPNAKKRATLDEIARHPWVLAEHDGPPPNYVPERPPLDPSNLDEGVRGRPEGGSQPAAPS